MELKGSKPIWINPVRFSCLFIISIIIYVFLNHCGGSLALHHGSILLLIFITLMIVSLSACMLIYMLKKQNNYVSVKYSVKHRSLLVLLGIISIFMSSIVSGIILLVFHSPQSLNERMINLTSNTTIGAVYIAIMLIFSPIVEEFFCRFMIIGPNPIGHHKTNKLIYGIRISVGILLFGLSHIILQLFSTHSAMSLISGLPYFATGAVLTYFYVHTQDIKVPITIHVLWDISLFIIKDLI